MGCLSSCSSSPSFPSSAASIRSPASWSSACWQSTQSTKRLCDRSRKGMGGSTSSGTEGFPTSAGGNMTLPFTHSWTTSARTAITSTKRQTSISFAGQTVLVQVTSSGASRPCCLRRTASSTWSRSSGERDSSLVPLVKPPEIWRQKRILSLSPACYADQDSSIKGSARDEKKPGLVAIFSGYKSFGLVVQLTV